MREAILFIGLLLIAGCTSEAPQEQEMTCEQFCPSQPHIQCVGAWEISGVYPDCSCNYVCEEGQPPAEVNETPDVPVNDTMEETPSQEPEDTPMEDIFPVNTKTVDELLDNGILRMRTEYLTTHDGQFETTEYKWKFSDLEPLYPGDVVFDSAPSTDVKFDGQVIESLRGAGFLVFVEGNDVDVRGVLIILERETVLDQKSVFDIEYFHSQDFRNMESCTVTSHDLSKDAEGKWISKYFVQCLDASG